MTLRIEIVGMGRILALLLDIDRKINNMANEQEAALDAALVELKTEIAAAAQRVIDKINEVIANNPDLTDELADVRTDIDAIKGIATPTP